MQWQTAASKSFTSRLGLQHPIVLAPMAGACTPALVAAVSNSGGLGMYGAALTPTSELRQLVKSIKGSIIKGNTWGINLFCPPAAAVSLTEQQQTALQQVHSYYTSKAIELKLECQLQPTPGLNLSELQDNFRSQIQVLLEEQVPVVSFYFGLPEEALLAEVKASGAVTIGTATCLDEAQQLEAAGIDCIVVQGSEAGGHRGTFYTTDTDYRQCMTGTTTLVALLAQHIKHCHLLAAGGIMTGQQVVAALAAGAAAAQLGTAFLTCQEAATSPIARTMLLQDHSRGTTVTQAFTSRPARGLITQVTKDLQDVQCQLPMSMIGLVNARPLFMAAAQAGLSEYVMQLCGQGYPLCREGSTAELMQRLVQEAESCVQHLTKGD